MSFDSCVEEVIRVEGGYSNLAADSGGETNFGITVAVARAFGYTGPMQMMSRDQAKAIYRQRFWDSQKLDAIFALSQPIAHELFESGVNLGVSAVGKFLQRTLNVFNRNGALYADIEVDGRVGVMTVAALREYLTARGKAGEIVMLRALNGLQATHYIELAERREKDEAFVYGQILNRVVI